MHFRASVFLYQLYTFFSFSEFTARLDAVWSVFQEICISNKVFNHVSIAHYVSQVGLCLVQILFDLYSGRQPLGECVVYVVCQISLSRCPMEIPRDHGSYVFDVSAKFSTMSPLQTLDLNIHCAYYSPQHFAVQKFQLFQGIISTHIGVYALVFFEGSYKFLI